MAIILSQIYDIRYNRQVSKVFDLVKETDERLPNVGGKADICISLNDWQCDLAQGLTYEDSSILLFLLFL